MSTTTITQEEKTEWFLKKLVYALLSLCTLLFQYKQCVVKHFATDNVLSACSQQIAIDKRYGNESVNYFLK